MMSVVELTDLTKQYKNGRGVKQLSLRVEQGQVYGLLGPNGSGKTTTMKAMLGLLRPDSGDVRLFGASPFEDVSGALGRVGCLIERPVFYPYLSAAQNLELVRRYYPFCPRPRVEEVLALTGLSQMAGERVSRFSLGMQQRLGLAMALLPDPELLVLDEPSNGLDIEGIASVRTILLQQADQGRTIFLSSHMAWEVEQVCTHVGILRDGVLVGSSTIPDLLSTHGGVERYYLDHSPGEVAV